MLEPYANNLVISKWNELNQIREQKLSSDFKKDI